MEGVLRQSLLYYFCVLIIIIVVIVLELGWLVASARGLLGMNCQSMVDRVN